MILLNEHSFILNNQFFFHTFFAERFFFEIRYRLKIFEIVNQA